MKRTIFILNDGYLRRKDNTLFYENADGRKHIPIENTKDIMVFGEVDFNKSLLEFLSQKEICLHYFNNYNGYYMGSFYPREHYNSGYMILKQAEHYSDASKRLIIACKFVEGAIKNMRQVIRYYNSRGKNLKDQIEQLSYYLSLIKDQSSIQELMAIEGNAWEQYYHSFDIILDNQDFRFEKRSKRPPKNCLNTLISFGNSVLYVTVLSEIYKTYLDPRIGYLHTTNFRRFTLNLDIAEIFKPIIVDRIIFSGVNKKVITKKDFEPHLSGLYLKQKGKEHFLREFDQRLQTTIKHRQLNRKVSYRQLIKMEAYKLNKHLMGEKGYEPFVAQW